MMLNNTCLGKYHSIPYKNFHYVEDFSSLVRLEMYERGDWIAKQKFMKVISSVVIIRFCTTDEFC